jgi:hypothetical protein
LSFSLCQKSIRARVFHPYSNSQAELRKTCLLGFDERALEEWHQPGAKVRELQNKKLAEVLKSPRIELTSYVGYLIATRQNPGPPVIDWYIRSSMKRLSYPAFVSSLFPFIHYIKTRSKQICQRVYLRNMGSRGVKPVNSNDSDVSVSAP